MVTCATHKRAAPKAQDAPIPASRPSKRAKVTQSAKPAATQKQSGRNSTRTQKATSTTNEPQGTPDVINYAPTEVLDVLVFGNGDNGELGLGPSHTEAPTPRVNSFLHAGTETNFHIVQMDCGGMHTVALTSKNQIVTWGVNDNGALGRSTDWSGGLRDVDDDQDENDNEDDDGDLNPLESTPTAIPSSAFPASTTFVQVAAGDSCSLALTNTGLVYGWGTFKWKNGDEMLSYDADRGQLVERQTTPALVQGLSGITQIACGANHALALDANRGIIWTWGCDEQNQLGRRIISHRHHDEASVSSKLLGLTPQPVHIRDIWYIATGEYHSFAVDRHDNVWAWGLNGFGQTGADPGNVGKDGADVQLPYPKKLQFFHGQKIAVLDGGGHHSVAITADGRCLTWGRLTEGQLGIEFRAEQLSSKLIRRDERGDPRICVAPTAVTAPMGLIRHAACGTDHTIFVSRDGAAFATGFNTQGQLGLGREDDVVQEAQRIGGKATVKRKITWAGAGGQFSVIAGPFLASPATGET